MSEKPIYTSQLHQSQRLETLGTLAGGIAHDFNNQLTVILNNLALALDSLDPAQTAHPYLEDADRAARRCAEMTRGLLEFSRRHKPSLRPADVSQLLEETARMLRRVLPASITLRILAEHDLPPILADATQIQQVIMNLAVNARDAMPEGGQLEISAEGAPGGVLLRVHDTGQGMSHAVRERAFEPFFTTKLGNGGTGLGLPTVFEIVRAHKGQIEVETAPDLGTTFRIWIPAATRTAPDRPARKSPAATIHASILLVEDDEMVRRAAATILRLNGCEVIEAADGEDALRLFEQHASSIDLVFTDYGMPRCGGPMLIERIRRIRPRVKVLLASGYGGPKSHEFLAKPYSAPELIKRIGDLLAA
jgi:two-component system, cell cycle sensor histidine kinase and response regulator CckA